MDFSKRFPKLLLAAIAIAVIGSVLIVFQIDVEKIYADSNNRFANVPAYIRIDKDIYVVTLHGNTKEPAILRIPTKYASQANLRLEDNSYEIGRLPITARAAYGEIGKAKKGETILSQQCSSIYQDEDADENLIVRIFMAGNGVFSTYRDIDNLRSNDVFKAIHSPYVEGEIYITKWPPNIPDNQRRSGRIILDSSPENASLADCVIYPKGRCLIHSDKRISKRFVVDFGLLNSKLPLWHCYQDLLTQLIESWHVQTQPKP